VSFPVSSSSGKKGGPRRLPGLLQTPGQLSPGLVRLGLGSLRRGGLGEMMAEVHGVEIPGRQQSQGVDFIACNGFAP